jgi:hypothetical protein
MRNKVIITIFFVFLFITTAFAQDFSLKAEVDKTSLAIGETLNYKITINYMGKGQAEPKIPKFGGFNVISSMQSSNMSFVKNNIQRNIVYIFILAPLDIGKFKIEPSVIKIGNKTYSTDTFEIEVTPDKARPKTPLEQRPSQPEKIQPESEEPQITL